MSIFQIYGLIFDYNESKEKSVKFKNNMFEEFKKFCEQEKYMYRVISVDSDYVYCNVHHSIIMYFVKCIQSENQETIKMLCSLPKEMLLNRVNGFSNSEDWIYRTDLKLVYEALKRYDEPIYVTERNKMAEYL